MTSLPAQPSDTTEALLAQLDAALDVEETRWEPQPGDKLLGTITALDLMPGQDRPYYVVRVVTPDERLVSFAASRARLRNQLAAAHAQPGDLLGVRYVGEQIAESSGRAFHEYRVVTVQQGPRDPQRVFLADPPMPGPAGDLLPDDGADAAAGDDTPPF